MKLFVIQQLYFKLPDNFKGTVKDAIKELAKYNSKSNGEVKRLNMGEIGNKSFKSINSTLFDVFLDGIEEDKCVAGIFEVKDVDL